MQMLNVVWWAKVQVTIISLHQLVSYVIFLKKVRLEEVMLLHYEFKKNISYKMLNKYFL
jgi:hypothetical protein